MKYHLIISILLVYSIFLGCEDKQKDSQKESSFKGQITDTVVPVKKREEKIERIYPVITEENVVDFLTEYGKNNPETNVLISTNFGDIEIELYKDTPLHRANFIYLVKQKYFDGTFFHRTVPNFIIQGGNSDNITTNRKRKNIGNKYRLPAELKNGRRHRYGTISGAKEYRKNPDKKSAPFEFFIFLGPIKHTAHLNGNYTIFGRVTKGMDMVENIANLPTDDGEWPIQNVYIEARVID